MGKGRAVAEGKSGAVAKGKAASDHGEEEHTTGWNDYGSVEKYEHKWIPFFREKAYDQFELQRGLNHCFQYDIVPTIPVLIEAIRAARRLNDFATASRVFGALREKCRDDAEYAGYVIHLDAIKKELSISSPNEFGRK